jgi:hypothetical protein
VREVPLLFRDAEAKPRAPRTVLSDTTDEQNKFLAALELTQFPAA